MAESSESGVGKIALKIKTTAVQYDVEVPEGATVGDVSGLNSFDLTPNYSPKLYYSFSFSKLPRMMTLHIRVFSLSIIAKIIILNNEFNICTIENSIEYVISGETCARRQDG